jgi:hypothetical protein
MAKVRKGFVSNSSSSSFICEISGQVESGYDASPFDCGMVRCVNDHTMMEEYAPKGVELVADEDYGGEAMSEAGCPICQLKEVRADDLVKFALKQLGVTEDQLKNQIRSKFKNLKEFEAALK